MSLTNDLRLARVARKHGAKWAFTIIREARSAGLNPSLAFALVEQESNFHNVFGHDHGSILHGEKVTKDRVKRLIAHVRKGGLSNGVGLTQLTYLPYIVEAERMGGAHRPKYQLRVGFRALQTLRLQKGLHAGIAAYNGSGSAAENYRKSVAHKAGVWHLRLT